MIAILRWTRVDHPERVTTTKWRRKRHVTAAGCPRAPKGSHDQNLCFVRIIDISPDFFIIVVELSCVLG
ncbi:hypothetical protein DEV91_104135 [Phyllobacterium brassicacearum]|nr:hypothetical protein DEV91_104135 [Phyllobacterium brassicacearum]